MLPLHSGPKSANHDNRAMMAGEWVRASSSLSCSWRSWCRSRSCGSGRLKNQACGRRTAVGAGHPPDEQSAAHARVAAMAGGLRDQPGADGRGRARADRPGRHLRPRDVDGSDATRSPPQIACRRRHCGDRAAGSTTRWPVRDDERSSRHRSLGANERGATQHRGDARCHRGRRSSPARLGGRCRRARRPAAPRPGRSRPRPS